MRDIGGFRGALDIVFSKIGAYFSSNLFKVALINDFFYNKSEHKNKTFFKRLNMSSLSILLSPILCIFDICSKRQRMKKQLIAQGMSRFKHSLEVTNLIKKTNSNSIILEELLNEKKIKDLLKYSKFNVLELPYKNTKNKENNEHL